METMDSTCILGLSLLFGLIYPAVAERETVSAISDNESFHLLFGTSLVMVVVVYFIVIWMWNIDPGGTALYTDCTLLNRYPLIVASAFNCIYVALLLPQFYINRSATKYKKGL